MKKLAINIDPILKENLQRINLTNTIGGGIAQTEMRLEQKTEGYYAYFRTPASHEDTFKIMLKENRLEIYRFLRVDKITGESTHIPLVVGAFPVPHFVDVANIEAHYENGVLKVFAPFKKNMGQDSQEIPIRQDT